MESPVSYLRRKLRPYAHVAAAVILVFFLVFAGIRFYSWQSLGESRRQLTLVNPWNPVSETGFTPRLVSVEDGFQADRSCAEALTKMLSDCRAAGNRPQLISGYRSMDEQLVLYDGEVQRRINEGKSPEAAELAVGREIARPGRSEHELGLAFDIVDAEHPEENAAQAETPTSRWLAENAWRYGFVLRYPENTESITGYSWHPWHYRYVGEDAAGNIYSLNITLEEYLNLFYGDEAAVVYEEDR